MGKPSWNIVVVFRASFNSSTDTVMSLELLNRSRLAKSRLEFSVCI